MTEATPLASEQITQEDREAAERLEEALGFLTREESRISEEHFARHRIAALSDSPAPSGQGFSWSFNTDTRDIEFGASPVFKVYEASDFPCLEDDERAEADKWYDAQAQTAVLMLNSLLHTDDEPVAAPAPSCAPGEVEGEPCRFVDCPPGLFRWGGLLCFKSEYSSKPGQPDAYCVDSGEYFWGGTNGDLEHRRNLMVTPLTAALSPQGKAERKWPGLSCVTSDEDVTRIADVPDTEIPTPVQAVRWLAKFSNPDEVASTTPRKIANELANICALLTLSPQGLDAKEGSEWRSAFYAESIAAVELPLDTQVVAIDSFMRAVARATPSQGLDAKEGDQLQHRGWNITRATVGYDIQHPDYDRENEIDWRYGHADTVEGARAEIDRLLAEDAEWTEAANIVKDGFAWQPAMDGRTRRERREPLSDAMVAVLASEFMRTLEPERVTNRQGHPKLLYTGQMMVDAFKAGRASNGRA